MLKSAGFPAQFVVDQGRAGQQNLRQQWGDWCNIKGAGFGTRPTTSTGNPLIDAIIWVKPGGESDGTSNSSSPRYDSTCSLVRFTPLCERKRVCSLLWCSPTRRSPHPRLEPGSRRTSRPLCRRPTRRCEGKRDGVRSCSRSVLYLVQNLGVSFVLLSIMVRTACAGVARLVVEDENALSCAHSLCQAAQATPTSYEYSPIVPEAIRNVRARSTCMGKVEIIFCEGLLDSAGKHRIHGGLIQTGHTVRI